MTQAFGSEIYQGYIAGQEAQRYWRGLPWVISAYEGEDGGRYSEMWQWCFDRLGSPRWPFGERQRPGHWRSGNARIFGWEWWGFSTKSEADAFLEAFPPPEFVRPGERH